MINKLLFLTQSFDFHNHNSIFIEKDSYLIILISQLNYHKIYCLSTFTTWQMFLYSSTLYSITFTLVILVYLPLSTIFCFLLDNTIIHYLSTVFMNFKKTLHSILLFFISMYSIKLLSAICLAELPSLTTTNKKIIIN